MWVNNYIGQTLTYILIKKTNKERVRESKEIM